MALNCYICNTPTIFYVWSTSRNFPRKALIKHNEIKTIHEKYELSTEGVPVCLKCLEKLKKDEL